MSNKTLNSIMFPGLENVYRIIAQAEEFLSTSTYDVGDYVTHEGYLYNCISPITSAGSWNSSKWTQVNLSSIVENLQKSLGDIYDPTSTYELDDRVTYQGILYKCTSAIPVAEAWNSSHWTILTVGEELKLLQDIKANIDGSYDSMTVGNAEQLIATQYIEDKIPYSFRHSGGSNDIGDREQDTLVGGTLVWNQLQQNNATGGTDAGITATNNGDGSWSVSGTSSAATWFYCNNSSAYIKIQTGHKYLLRGFPSNSGVFYWKFRNADSTGTSSLTDGGAGYIYAASSSFNANIGIGVYADKAITGTATVYPQVFDLTLLFGSAIADYVYSLETANAGAGVAWFRKLFPKPYYAYDAGTLESGRASAHKTVGFNQWDEQWQNGRYDSTTGVFNPNNAYFSSKKFKVIGGATYYARLPLSMTGISWYWKSDGTFMGQGILIFNDVFIVPDDAVYMAFGTTTAYGTTYKHDICINLSWSGTRNGEYEPYVQHTYPLDSSLTLRGIPKLDASNNFYYDGDIYKADGTVTRRYGIVDLGTLSWQYNSAYAFFESAQIADGKSRSEFVCDTYTYGGTNTTQSDMASAQDKSVYSRITAGAKTIVYVKDTAYSDVATFKTAMSGVYLVYELDTPTTENAEPFATSQIVNDFGTEEYIDAKYEAGNRDFIFPQGHNTKYPANLRDKLQHLPDLANNRDGDYIIRQTGTNMSLTPFPIHVDPTLSIEGAAADSKATGDKLGELKSALKYFSLESHITSDWENKNQYGTDTTNQLSVVLSRNEISRYLSITAPNGYTVGLSANNLYVWTASGWSTSGILRVKELDVGLVNLSTYNFYRIVILADDQSDILPAFGNNVTFRLKTNYTLAETQNALDAIEDAETASLLTKTGYITNSIVQYWNAGSYGLIYFKCRQNTRYHIIKKSGNLFAVAYIKTSPAANVPVYNYIDFGGYETDVFYQTGDDAQYILIQATNNKNNLPDILSVTTAQYILGAKDTKLRESLEPTKGYATATGNMNNGTTLLLPRTNNKKNQVYSFSGAITSFTSLQIGNGNKTSFGNSWIEITTAKVIVHNYTGSDGTTEYNHGLTISSFIYVTIVVPKVPNGNAKLTIETNGAVYSESIPWAGYGYGGYFATSNGSVLTNCKFTWSSGDFGKNVWVFGDSYISIEDPARWAYYLNADGFLESNLLNGYPGETSTVGYDALENAITYGRPKFILWCLGMNDGQDIDAPGASWLEKVNSMLKICQMYDIVPILATIPTVPNMNHEYRNDWIRNSGYRYVDFAQAVGAQSDGTWYTGMLSGDSVHPTVLGANALYQRVLLDFPEISY